ncbi:MAG: TRAP transporter small permease [Burkholderiaceae bacterium]|nr:TRAP transporter small permease [Burkholderiaceae bacterium]
MTLPRSPGSGRLLRLLGLTMAAILFLLMLVTFVDVMGRYLFSLPLPGAFELTQILMAVLIFSGLPLVCADDVHIRVDIALGSLSDRSRRRLGLFNHLVSTLALAALAWRLWVKAGATLAAGDQSMYLGLPMYPVCYLMFLLTALAAGFSGAHLVESLRRARYAASGA